MQAHYVDLRQQVAEVVAPLRRGATGTIGEKYQPRPVELANGEQRTEAYLKVNPRGRVPALGLDNGEVLYESLLICEYLDHMAGGGVLFPKDRTGRLAMLRRHALGNGLMEVSVLRRVESVRGKDPDRDNNIARQSAITVRALDLMEALAPSSDDELELGNVSIVIALDYLDFRFPGDAWRKGRPALAAWYEQYSKRDSLQSTLPGDPQSSPANNDEEAEMSTNRKTRFATTLLAVLVHRMEHPRLVMNVTSI